MIEFENRLKKIHEDITALEESRQLIINIYNEKIAFNRLIMDLVCIDYAEKDLSNYRILSLCRTGK